MKKILLALSATTALAAGAPAAAQYAGGNLDARVDQLQTQLQVGVRSGAISRDEAMPLRDQLRLIERLERQYRPGGISGRERADLQRRTNALRQQIRMAERTDAGRDRYGHDDSDDGRWGGRDRDGDGRRDMAGRYGRDDDDRYNRSADDRGRWGASGRDVDSRTDVAGRYARDGDDRYQRDDDSNGRWRADRYEGRDSDASDRRRADAQDERSPSGQDVLGQIVDRFTGGGLRVGQQAPASLYGVPMADRDRYRDGNGAYYRSDGRQTYQVDARTHLIARIYPMSR